ncbi:MAG: D-glycero-alpha-D-manno-heptose-1,7-bisphosphate 7-phosphatase [Isosphaeraceae bacterium]|jgi:D-glycero-D-manno-heptose 1,7-bisphosphate phosphatase
MSRFCVFLDKDGTLVDDVPYNVDPERIHLTRGADQGLMWLHRAGYRLIVVSNQAGVALGRFPESALAGVKERLEQMLREIGVPLAGFYYCPHHPDGHMPGYGRACRCRKPQPGLITRAARDHGIDLSGSWFVGDILDDVEAGRRAGCRTVFLDNGHETEWKRSRFRWPHLVASDLAEAARRIIETGAAERSGYRSGASPSTRSIASPGSSHTRERP